MKKRIRNNSRKSSKNW